MTDPQNLVVPGATVVIHNTGTGIDRTLKSNEAGIYVATFLQPGYYEVRASKEGLAEVVRKDLTLQVGQTLTIRHDSIDRASFMPGVSRCRR